MFRVSDGSESVTDDRDKGGAMREAALLLLGAVFASLIMAGGAAWASRGYAYHRVLGGLLRRHRRGRLYLGGDDMVLRGGRGNDGLEEQPVGGEWTRPSVLSEPTLEVRHNRPPPKVASRMTQDTTFSFWAKPSSELLLIDLLKSSA